MPISPNILAEIRLPDIDLQLIEWCWPTPMDVVATEDRHMIEMSLPPFATDGRACFPDVDPEGYGFMGNIFLRPAGMQVRAKSAGGQIRVVRCAVDPERYAATVGRYFEWTPAELATCLNLRGGAMQSLLHRLRQELEAPGLASVALVEAYSSALMIETARCITFSREVAAHGRLAAWQYRKVAERLAEPGPAPNVAELADLCGIGSRHFLRLFHNLTGETVTAHIERVRMDRARQMLIETDLPLKEIAARLGFAHAGNFSAAFRRVTDSNPRLFRQRNRRHRDFGASADGSGV